MLTSFVCLDDVKKDTNILKNERMEETEWEIEIKVRGMSKNRQNTKGK